MPYSVEISDPWDLAQTPRIYDVVVRQPAVGGFRAVDLVRGTLRRRLCRIAPNILSGWDVIVEECPPTPVPPDQSHLRRVADPRPLTGPNMVRGFATIRSAYEYAILVRPDVNRRSKDMP